MWCNFQQKIRAILAEVPSYKHTFLCLAILFKKTLTFPHVHGQ